MSLNTLKNVIECLRETGRFVDEEGEATNALEDLLRSISPPDKVKLDGDQALRANELLEAASANPDLLESLARELVWWREGASGVLDAAKTSAEPQPKGGA